MRGRVEVEGDGGAAEEYVSVWDTAQAAEANYRRALELLEVCESAGDRTRAVVEIRQHLQFARSIVESLFAPQEIQAFMDEVLMVLDEFEPGSRQKIIARLEERRVARRAARKDVGEGVEGE